MNDYSLGAINVEDCVFDYFLLSDHLPLDKAAAIIERDLLECREKDTHKVVIDVNDAADRFSDAEKIKFA